MIEVRFTKERETKRTWRFAEQTDEAEIMGTIYVQKHALKKLGDPNRLVVTIEKEG